MLTAQSGRLTECNSIPSESVQDDKVEGQTPVHRCVLPQIVAPPAHLPAASAAIPTPISVKREAHWEISTQIGMYVPIVTLTRAADDAAGETRRQVGAGAIGARLGVRFTSHFGVEGALFYSRSLVAVSDDLATEDLGGGVLLGSARGVARIGRSPNGWNLYLASGVGLIARHGTAWTGMTGTADPALVVAAGAKVPLGKSRFAFRLDAENYISRAQFETQAAGVTRGRLQHDILWSLGVAIPVAAK